MRETTLVLRNTIRSCLKPHPSRPPMEVRDQFPSGSPFFSNQHNSSRERLDSNNDNDFLGQSINKKVDCAEAAHEHDEHVFALVVRSTPLTLITFYRVARPMIVYSTHITSMWLSKELGL